MGSWDEREGRKVEESVEGKEDGWRRRWKGRKN